MWALAADVIGYTQLASVGLFQHIFLSWSFSARCVETKARGPAFP